MLIRYPGSKAKLVDQIIPRFPWWAMGEIFDDGRRRTYAEPFFGAGAIGFAILRRINRRIRIVLNDKDYGLTCLWQSVWRSPNEIVGLILDFEPTVEKFHSFKEADGDVKTDPVLCGFRKLALHQMSYSGFGAMSGGPLGGQCQENAKYRVDCRWNPERLVADVWSTHELLRRFRSLEIRCRDFTDILGSLGQRDFAYIDPPYFVQGKALYKHSLDDDGHGRLARLLRDASFLWVLSYDDCDEIRELYRWANHEELLATYTVARQQGQRPKNKELLISR